MECENQRDRRFYPVINIRNSRSVDGFLKHMGEEDDLDEIRIEAAAVAWRRDLFWCGWCCGSGCGGFVR